MLKNNNQKLRVQSLKAFLFILVFLVVIFLPKIYAQPKPNIEEFERSQPLTIDQKELLEKNSFVVTPSDFDQIYQIYNYAARQNLPIYITTDAVLHTLHILFDYSLRVTEMEYFYKLVSDLTDGLLDYESAKYKQTKSSKVKEAHKRNMAYLSVAASLLDKNFEPLPVVAKLVKAELKSIAEHKAIRQSEIFDYKEDYSQYQPRGHYTRNEKFARYFKAMMWFGRIGFYLKPGDTRADIELGRDLTRQAILLVDALKKARVGDESVQKIWEKIYNPLTFLIGKTDDLDYYSYAKLIAQVFPNQDIYKKLEKNEQIDKFIAEAVKLPTPKILATFVLDTTQTALAKRKGFKLLGQRYIPDSYMFQQLVYSKVGTFRKPRHLPKGLDVMAVLGSNRAQEILNTVYQENQFLNYTTQMLKLRTEFKQLITTEWNQSVYFAWLYALKLLLEPLSKSPNLPQFLFSPAYADKTLMTTCGSWTELRHDTILYAKQSYTAALTAIRPQEKQPGFVEPYPKFYEQIARIVLDLANGLKRYGVLNEEVGNRLASLKSLAQKLKLISVKEISGENLDDEELQLINNIGETLETMVTFPSQFEKYSSEADDKMAVVADVHTDPNTLQVLEEAVGNPFFIYAIIPYQQKNYLAVGGVFSYYEFTKPIGERMTDEEWQKIEPKPDLPVWTKSFVIK